MDDLLTNEIRDLMASGRKIEAIKLYREATGATLAEAKAAVEGLGVGEQLAAGEPADVAELAEKITELLRQGEKLEAIKVYREQTGVGLKEAKTVVDQIGVTAGIATSGGCLGVVLLAAGVTSLVGRLVS